MYTCLQDRRKISTFKHFEGNTVLSAVITSVVQVAKLTISPPLVIREVLGIRTTVRKNTKNQSSYMTIILKEEEQQQRTTQKPMVLCQVFHKNHRFFQCLKQPEPVALQF
jgi:hypothetical protein